MATIAFAQSLLASLRDLEPREQSLVWAFVNKFMEERVRQGTKLERVTRTKVPNLWSARINQDLRAILWVDGDTSIVLYAGHHDAAYLWAEHRELHHDLHTNRLQILETTERQVEVVREVVVRVAPALLAGHDDAYLVSLGVPSTWLPALKQVRTEDQLLEFCVTLPDEVGEALFELASGKVVTPPAPEARATLLHADAGRRYHVVENEDELSVALAGALEDWMLFLHPAQRQIVEGIFAGPAQVIGAAGTGKTAVALHRARELARRGARVLVATFTRALAENLSKSLDRLCTPAERARIEVSTLHRQALQFAKVRKPTLQPIDDKEFRQLLAQAVDGQQLERDVDLLMSEWRGVIQPGGITDWPGYRDAIRVGRGRALTAVERRAIWDAIASVRTAGWKDGRLDWSGICGVACKALQDGEAASPFQAVLVDEVQDLGAAELRLVQALAKPATENLMLFGDTGQRIYGQRAAQNHLGIDVAGRIFTLRTNYRTTEAIRRTAEALFGVGPEQHEASRSLLRGPQPILRAAGTLAEENSFIVTQLEQWEAIGIRRDEIAFVARSGERLESLQATLTARSIPTCGLLEARADAVRVGPIHGTKGLEFKAVGVVGCEDQTIPHRYTVETFSDPLDREAQLERERHAVYVAMTRAREELLVTWVGEPSRWLAGPIAMARGA